MEHTEPIDEESKSKSLGHGLAVYFDAPAVFRNYSKSLWLSLLSCIAYMIGLALFGVHFGANLAWKNDRTPPWLASILVVALGAIILGVILSLWARQRSLEFSLPVPWRSLLKISYYCEMSSIGFRFIGRQIGLGKIGQLIAFPLQLVSWIAFWLFLIKLCTIIGRRKLVTLGIVNLTVWAIAVLGFVAVTIGARFKGQIDPRLALLSIFSTAVLTAIGCVTTFAVLFGTARELRKYASELEEYMLECETEAKDTELIDDDDDNVDKDNSTTPWHS